MSDGKESVPCYVGRAPCGCIVTAIVDAPDLKEQMKKEIAKFMRDCLKEGLTIDRVTVDFVRSNFGHKCAPKQEPLFA